MRWYRQTKKVGDKRIIHKFAIFPICINNEYRWLERVTIEQIRIEQLRFDEVGHPIPVLYWVDECFYEKEK